VAAKAKDELWDDPRVTAFGMLLEAHAAVMADVGRELEQAAGVPVQWFEVLLRLARSPEHRLRMTELATQVRLSTSGLTRLIDRIEEAGHVTREACPSDRRGAYAVLTPDGEQVLRAALPAHLDTIDHRIAVPLGDQLTAATDLLRVLRDGGR
jgi:DNA-binding MarR family transcriptional regulator